MSDTNVLAKEQFLRKLIKFDLSC